MEQDPGTLEQLLPSSLLEAIPRWRDVKKTEPLRAWTGDTVRRSQCSAKAGAYSRVFILWYT